MAEVLLYRNQSIDLQIRSLDWFLYDREHRQERVKDYAGYISKNWGFCRMKNPALFVKLEIQ